MNTIKELTQQEKYKTMLKRKNREIERLKIIEEKYKDSHLYIKDYKDEIERLTNRIDKAIEYIENHTYDRSDVFVFKGFYPDFYIEKVLDILKGSDKE